MAGTEGLKAASTLTGQLITVSAGLLAFTVTFADKFAQKEGRIAPPLALKVSWVCFVASILFGFWTLMALAGTFDEIDRNANSNPGRGNIRIPAIIMIVIFFLGVVFLIGAGWTVAG